MHCIKNSGNGPPYVTKIDLQDAFSNVDIKKLNNLSNKQMIVKSIFENSISSVNDGLIIRCHNIEYYYWHRGIMLVMGPAKH